MSVLIIGWYLQPVPFCKRFGTLNSTTFRFKGLVTLDPETINPKLFNPQFLSPKSLNPRPSAAYRKVLETGPPFPFAGAGYNMV